MNVTSSTGKPTIVFVESWFSSHPLHRYWARYLEKKGFRVLIYNFPLQKGDFSKSAKDLSSFIEEHSLSHVTLVGISNGGITAYLYLQEFDGWHNVSTFISVGTAFKGTFWAYFLPFFSSTQELIPGSKLLREIEKQPVKNPERILILTALFDELVPLSSSVLRGVQTQRVDVIGHNFLHLASSQTYDVITNESSEV